MTFKGQDHERKHRRMSAEGTIIPNPHYSPATIMKVGHRGRLLYRNVYPNHGNNTIKKCAEGG